MIAGAHKRRGVHARGSAWSGGLRLRLQSALVIAKSITVGVFREEWKGGSNMRVVDVVAPFGGEAEMRGQIGSGN